MHIERLRARLTRALLLSLAAPIASCCEVKETRVVLHEATDPARPWQATATCPTLCLVAGDCGVRTLLRCEVTGAAGAREATCVFETSDCPTRPGLWGDCGRRCEGATCDPAPACVDPVGARFAAMAALEAESVPAFERLAAELRAHAAPPSLVRGAMRAARDERRHARSMTALARAYGAEAPVTRAPAPTVRPLFDVAAENVAEGCVRETFGALVARWQSRRCVRAT